MKNILIILFLLFVVATMGAGGYSYYVITKDRARLVEKNKEIERLTQSSAFLSKKLSEVEEARARFEREAEALRTDAQKYEGEKRVILEQVRTAVTNFDTYQRESGAELERLRASVTALEAEKKSLSEKVASAMDLSQQEKEALNSQIRELSGRIEGQKDEQQKLIEQVEGLQKSPVIENAFKLHYNLGNFYFRQRQYKAAAHEYGQALAYRPDDAEAHFNLALVSDEYLGDSNTAILHYKKYLSLNPDGEDTPNVRTRLLDLEIGQRIKESKVPGEKPMEFYGVDEKKAKSFSMAEDKK